MTPLTLDEKRQRIAEADAVEQYRRDVALDERQADAQRQAEHEQAAFNQAAEDAAQAVQSYFVLKQANDTALADAAILMGQLIENRGRLKRESNEVYARLVRWATLGLQYGFLTNPLGDPAALAEDEIKRLTKRQNADLLWSPSVPDGWASEVLNFAIDIVANWRWR